MQAEVQLVR